MKQEEEIMFVKFLCIYQVRNHASSWNIGAYAKQAEASLGDRSAAESSNITGILLPETNHGRFEACILLGIQ